MTPELLSLRKKMDLSKQVYDGLGLRNVSGKPAEELVQMDVEYHHAKQTWLSAYTEYQKALEAFVKK